MSNIIIFGKMGTGKDTVAKLLGLYGYTKVKLGAPIREKVDEVLGKDYEGDRRKMYQEYGQCMRRIFGENHWNNTLASMVSDVSPEINLVIADGRQLNEYDFWAKERGFIPVGIVADDEVRKARLLARDGVDQSAQFNHDTELQAGEVVAYIESIPMGYVINNNGSVEDLIDTVVAIINDIHKEGV